MIVGAAQVVVNVADLDTTRAALLAEPGMSETFAALDLPNNPAKAPFQSVQREWLAMVHLAPAGGLAVELTRYEGPPPAGVAAYELRRDGGGPPVVTAATWDRDASTRFWTEGLHFKEGDDEGVLSAPAMHPAWRLDVELGPEGPGPGETTVDADGCVLITLLSTGIERDLEHLEETGLVLRSTAPWREQVADRQAHVAFVEGPSGELVELLEAPRPATG